jgi:hypothetical protein
MLATLAVQAQSITPPSGLRRAPDQGNDVTSLADLKEALIDGFVSCGLLRRNLTGF